MNVTEPPRLPPEDETDGLLRAFYRNEMPHPWPAWKAPAAPQTPPAPSRAPLWRSRLALAASVALLALGTLLLSGKAPRERQSPTRPAIGSGAAKREKVKSSLSLEQPRNGPTKIKVEAYELLPMK